MVGILAYGSLNDDPGSELGPLVAGRIEDVETPFPVEFTRRSRTRDGSPTLVPVSEGGAGVRAAVLVLEERVAEREATDMLWRREIRREGSGALYAPPRRPGSDTVLVRRLEGFEGLDVVLYAGIGANIPHPNPTLLAELAIRSAASEAGRRGRDGIRYLIQAKNNGVSTPLMPEYEREILRLADADTLEEARAKVMR